MNRLLSVLAQVGKWSLILTAGFHILFIGVTSLVIFSYNWINPPVTGFMIWRALGGTKNQPTIPLPLEEIPKSLKSAFISLEDYQFPKHFGFDLEGITRAMELNRRTGRFYAGGSTISQQLARNLFLTPQKTLFRKYLEALVTLELETILSKDRILELYLNNIEFGPGIYGLGAAARYHYKKPFSQLSRDQRFRLAVIITSPLRYGVYSFGGNPGMMQRYQFLLNRS